MVGEIERIMKLLKYENYLFLTLITFTLVVVLLQKYSLNEHRIFNIASNDNITIISDSDKHKGLSSAKLTQDHSKYYLHCNIRKSNYPWPFCEFQVNLFNEMNKYGLDLSHFSEIVVSARYRDKNKLPIRFQIRSYEPGHSSLNNSDTWKYNGMQYQYKQENDPAIIPVKSLQVSSWWVAEQKLPINKTAINLEQSMMIEIATGSNMPAGDYVIEISSIQFNGKYFSTSQVYLFLLIFWVLAALYVLLSHLQYSKDQLKQSTKKAIELKKLNKLLNVETKKLQESTNRDPLTGALNRAGVQPIFTDQLPELSIIFIDVDHFKQINDNHGHSVGDEVLIKLVKNISECCRQSDLLARWGGEEFLLVCPNTDLIKANLLAEELRKTLENSDWPNTIRLTASFGVGEREKNEDISDFIHRTDMALYQAKVRGRNQVVMSKAPEVSEQLKTS